MDLLFTNFFSSISIPLNITLILSSEQIPLSMADFFSESDMHIILSVNFANNLSIIT